jgi:peptidoglycan hydrolase CwlO-like protein
MATTEERVRKLEVRVDTLETWAGPGQLEALVQGQRVIRADLAKLRADQAKIQKTQNRHSRQLEQLTTDVEILKADVAELKADMADVKTTLQELLRRLPPGRD